MSRCVHGFEDSIFDSCPRCAEERRQRERAAEAAEEQSRTAREALEAQRRHQLDVQRSQEHQELLLQEAQSAQERAAAAKERQHELQVEHFREEKARIAAAEQRLELRTGLPEFSDAYRQLWFDLAAAHEQLLQREATLRDERSRLAKERELLIATARNTLADILKDLSSNLDHEITTGTPRLQDPPRPLSQSPERQELLKIADGLRSAAQNIGATPATKGHADGPLITIYRLLSCIVEKTAKLEVKSIPVLGPGCALFFLGVPTLISLSYLGKDPIAPLLLLGFGVPLAAILGLPIYRVALRTRIGTTYTPATRSFQQLDQLLARTTDLELDRLSLQASPAQLSSATKLTAIRSGAKVMLHDVFAVLLAQYTTEHMHAHHLAEQHAGQNQESERMQSRLAEIDAELARSKDVQKRERRFSATRAEVQRVGRLILDGRRLPGRTIELVPCRSCTEPLSAETAQCPYCGEQTGGEVGRDLH